MEKRPRENARRVRASAETPQPRDLATDMQKLVSDWHFVSSVKPEDEVISALTAHVPGLRHGTEDTGHITWGSPRVRKIDQIPFMHNDADDE
jgi:hypothetical protein